MKPREFWIELDDKGITGKARPYNYHIEEAVRVIEFKAYEQVVSMLKSLIDDIDYPMATPPNPDWKNLNAARDFLKNA